MRAVCSRGPLAQPSHRFPFPTAQTNPALPCCPSHRSAPLLLAATLTGLGALEGSSKATKEGCGLRGSGCRALGAPKSRLLRGAAYCRNCFLFPSGKNRCVCPGSPARPARPGPARGLPAPRLLSLLHTATLNESLVFGLTLWDPKAQQPCFTQGEVTAQHRNACTDHIHLYRTETKTSTPRQCSCPWPADRAAGMVQARGCWHNHSLLPNKPRGLRHTRSSSQSPEHFPTPAKP